MADDAPAAAPEDTSASAGAIETTVKETPSASPAPEASSGQPSGGGGAAPSLPSPAAVPPSAPSGPSFMDRLRSIGGQFENEDQLFGYLSSHRHEVAQMQRDLEEMRREREMLSPHMPKFYEWYQAEQAKSAQPQAPAAPQYDLPDELADWDIPMVHQYFEQNEAGNWIPKPGTPQDVAQAGMKFIKHYTGTTKNLYRKPTAFFKEAGFVTKEDMARAVEEATQKAISQFTGELQGRDYKAQAAAKLYDIAERHYKDDREGGIVFKNTTLELEQKYPGMDKQEILDLAHEITQGRLARQRAELAAKQAAVRNDAGLPAKPDPISPAVSSLPTKVGRTQTNPSQAVPETFADFFKDNWSAWEKRFANF